MTKACLKNMADDWNDYAHALHAGLAAEQKSIPSRFFYDDRGSELFEQITELEEYYPTRTEIDLLKENASRIADDVGRGCLVVEFGSGSSRKTEIVLDHLEEPAGYVAIEVSAAALAEATERLGARYPKLTIKSLVADFNQNLLLEPLPPHLSVMGFFPGSTIGNFSPLEAEALLRRFRVTLGKTASLIVGVDLQKARDLLIAAYNDSLGVTAEFNLNLLHRANREARASFDVSEFRHQAIYNEEEHRIEMHLISLRNQRVRIGSQEYIFRAGETIHTENSYKYTVKQFSELAIRAGWSVVRTMVDDQALFSVHQMRPLE